VSPRALLVVVVLTVALFRQMSKKAKLGTSIRGLMRGMETLP